MRMVWEATVAAVARVQHSSGESPLNGHDLQRMQTMWSLGHREIVSQSEARVGRSRRSLAATADYLERLGQLRAVLLCLEKRTPSTQPITVTPPAQREPSREVPLSRSICAIALPAS